MGNVRSELLGAASKASKSSSKQTNFFISIKDFLSCQAEAASLFTLPYGPAGRFRQTAWAPTGLPAPQPSSLRSSSKRCEVVGKTSLEINVFICLFPICSPPSHPQYSWPAFCFTSVILLHIFIFPPLVIPSSLTTCSRADLKLRLHGKGNHGLKHSLVDCCFPVMYKFLGRFKRFFGGCVFCFFKTGFWRKNECDYSASFPQITRRGTFWVHGLISITFDREMKAAKIQHFWSFIEICGLKEQRDAPAPLPSCHKAAVGASSYSLCLGAASQSAVVAKHRLLPSEQLWGIKEEPKAMRILQVAWSHRAHEEQNVCVWEGWW